MLTTDPALRLRTALRLEDSTAEQLVLRDPASGGELWAALLDVRATLDEAVRATARPGEVDRILQHPIYATIADSLSGMQELMAVERIDQFRRRGFEQIVIDTAPTSHALEILDKPVLFAELAGSHWVKLIGRTYKLVERTGMMALGRKTLDVYARVEAMLGAKLVSQVLDFYSLFLPMAEGYAERARKTVALLKDPAITEFRVVTSPQKALRDVKFFRAALEKRGFRLSEVMVNRVWKAGPSLPAGTRSCPRRRGMVRGRPAGSGAAHRQAPRRSFRRIRGSGCSASWRATWTVWTRWRCWWRREWFNRRATFPAVGRPARGTRFGRRTGCWRSVAGGATSWNGGREPWPPKPRAAPGRS